MLFFSKLSKRLKNVWSVEYFSEVDVVDILLFLIVGPIFIVYDYIINKFEDFLWKFINFYTFVDRKLFSYRLEIMYYMGKYQNSIIYMDLALRSLSAFINFYLHVNPSTLETYLDPFLKNLLKNFALRWFCLSKCHWKQLYLWRWTYYWYTTPTSERQGYCLYFKQESL